MVLINFLCQLRHWSYYSWVCGSSSFNIKWRHLMHRCQWHIPLCSMTLPVFSGMCHKFSWHMPRDTRTDVCKTYARRGTESTLLEVQCKVSTVSDGLGCHVICWCWSTVFSEVQGQHSRIPGSFRALHASCCWPTLLRCRFHFPTGLGTCTQCQSYQYLV